MRRLAFVSLVLVGCSGSHMLVDPGPVPMNGMQIILDPVKNIQPGTDNELCTWTSTITQAPLNVKAVQGLQSVSGHHIVVYHTKVFQPAGTTRVCTDQDMTTVRFLAGAGGEGVSDKNTAPGDLAFTVPAGEQIVINHHYINATPKPLDAQTVVNLFYADPAANTIPSGALAIVDTNLHLAPGTPTKDIHCTMQDDLKAWYQIPHMHAYGSLITVDHVATSGTERVFDTSWSPEYTFHPPVKQIDPSTTPPMLLTKGDQINVHCEWNNTTGSELTFGIEMCVFFAQTIDDTHKGSLACDGGIWTDF
jgi:hypothetical protein